MQISFARIGFTTSILESVATSIGAGIVLGGFIGGAFGVVLGWSRQSLEERALRDGYIGGIGGAVTLAIDLITRYIV